MVGSCRSRSIKVRGCLSLGSSWCPALDPDRFCVLWSDCVSLVSWVGDLVESLVRVNFIIVYFMFSLIYASCY